MIQPQIVIADTIDAQTECAADRTLTLMLAVAKQAAQPALLSGKTLGIVGFGAVGQAVARRARWGFGMDVVVHDPSPIDPETLIATGARTAESLDELLPQSDIVSLHCLETRHAIDARRLDQMKPEALLIDTAGGNAIDQQALVHALWFETIGGAGLDGEAGLLAELHACTNAVVLPRSHTATSEIQDVVGFRTANNATALFHGHVPHDRVA